MARMQMLLHILFFLHLAISLSETSGQPCYLTTVCTGFKTYATKGGDEATTEKFKLETEHEIATNGHFHGIVPQHYRIDFNFMNLATFEGSVNITVKTIRATSQIAINFVPSTVEIDYRQISIRSVCTENADMVMNGCIEKVTILKKDQVLIIDLKGAELEADREWIISFPSVQGQGVDANDGQKVSEEDATFNLFSTLFNLRNARILLPCFDHPALKARFELCLERPSAIGVVSNTPIDPGQSKVIGVDRLKDCFEMTPPITTSSFAFILFMSPPYIMESVEVPYDGPIIQLIADEKAMGKVREKLNSTILTIDYVGELTGLEYPLKKLTLLVSQTAPILNSNSLGLMYLSESWHLFFHLVITQWIGNIVTVSEWRESCLQYGLELFFILQIEAGNSNRPIQDVANELLNQLSSEYDPPLATTHFDSLAEVDKVCSSRPGFFFNTLSQFYDPSFEGTVVQFTRRLFKKKAWQTANIQEWDEILDEMLENEEHPMKGYFQGWFLQPGQLYLLSSRISSDCIIVRQKVLGPYAPSPEEARPVPVRIHVFGESPKSIKIVLKSLKERICGIDGEFLIDPEGASLTRKAYNAKNYQALFGQMKRNPGLLNLTQEANTLRDFCLSLILDLFPLPDDKTGSVATWLEILEHVQNSHFHFGPLHDNCHCCLSIAMGIQTGLECDKEACKKLKLSKILAEFSQREEL